MFDFVFEGIDGAAGVAGGDITISRHPAGDVLPGQGIHFQVDSIFDFPLPAGVTQVEGVDLHWDYGDPGATFTVGKTSGNATRGFGTDVEHTFAEPGTYTVTCTARIMGGEPVVRTMTINVVSVASQVWTREYYVSFANNFSGAPAATTTIRHINSEAALKTAQMSTGFRAIFRFRKGETFNWNGDTNGLDCGDASLLYVCPASQHSFGTGADPLIYANGTSNVYSASNAMFTMGGNGTCEIVICNLKLDGGYDARTGQGPRGSLSLLLVGGSNTNAFTLGVSMYQCDGEGVVRMISGGGSSAQPHSYRVKMHDCRAYSWFDYSFTFSGGETYFAGAGLNFRQPPLSARRAGQAKPNIWPGAAYHGCGRVNGMRRFGISESDLFPVNGWSPLSIDTATQPCLRLHPLERMTGECWANIQTCKGRGRQLVALGTVNATGDRIGQGWTVVAKNEFYPGPQSQAIVTLNMTGAYIHDNVVYQPNLFQNIGVPGYEIVRLETVAYAGTLPGTLTRPIKAYNNTYCSDRGPESGGNNPLIVFNVEAGWPGTTPTEDANILFGPNTTGTYADYGPLSRGDNFIPVTGSAAINGKTGNINVRDFFGNLRGPTTNIGAYDTSVATAMSVAPPVNVSAPAFAESVSWPGEWQPTTQGGWTGWDEDDRWHFEYDWRINGVKPTITLDGQDRDASTLTRFTEADSNDLPGSLTLEIVATNRSGVRVRSAVSASVAVP